MITSLDIVRETPCEPNRTRHLPAVTIDWRKVVAFLAPQPGEWWRIAVFNDGLIASQYAHRIRHGLINTLAEVGEFEATCRSVAGERRLYARFLGGGS